MPENITRPSQAQDFMSATISLVLACTVKPVFFVCPLFREFHEPGKSAKITGRENLNAVVF